MKHAWWLAGVCAAGCAIPERTNPDDSANAPVADLRVVDASAGSGWDCDAIPDDDSVVFPTVLVASRGRCIALDARGSSDPNGDPLFFRFTVTESDGTLHVLGDGPDRYAVLATSLKFTLTSASSASMTAEVFVRDEEDGTVERSASQAFTLTNARPEIVSVDPPRTYPAGGHAWARGQDFQVPFAAVAHDPDGPREPLQYCWSFGGEPPVCRTDPADPTFTRVVPSGEGTLVGSLVVRDGPGPESNEAHAIVRVRDFNLWVYDPFAEVMARGDVDREAITFNGAVDVVFTGGSPGAIATASNTEVRLYRTSDGALLHSEPHSGTVVLAADPARDRLWVGSYSTDVTVSAWTLPATRDGVLATTSSTPFEVDTDPQYGIDTQNQQGHLVIDGATGDAWFAAIGRDKLMRIEADGTVTETVLDGISGGLSRHPDGSVWLLEVPAPLSTVTASQVRQLPAGESITLPETDAAAAFEWVDDERFWVVTRDRGLMLLEMPLLRQGLAPEDSAAVRIGGFWRATFASTTRWAAEPVSGTLRIMIESETLTTVRTDATVLSDPLGGVAWRPSDLDAESRRFWTSSFSGVRSGSTIATYPYFEASHHQIAQAWPSDDGGFWAYSNAIGTRLERYAEDARLLRAEDGVELDGVLTAIPPFQFPFFQASADGTSLWGIEPGGLRHVDLSPDVPVMTQVLDAPSTTGMVLLGSSVPALGPPFVWVMWVGGNEIGTVDLSGQVDVRYTIPPGDLPPAGTSELTTKAAVSPVSNRLCLVIDSSGTGRAAWIVPAGGATAAQGTSPNPSATRRIATSWDSDGDVCWTSGGTFGVTFDLLAWDAAGNVLNEALGLTGIITSLSARGTDRVFMTRFDGPTRSLDRVQFDAGGALSGTLTMVSDDQSSHRLIP